MTKKHGGSKIGMLLGMILASLGAVASASGAESSHPLWEQAKVNAHHRYSTLFTAQDVKNHLSTEEGTKRALEWCKQTGVTKVFIETFRDGYQAERGALARARDRFKEEGFIVSGCITPTKVGKPSTGWNLISCYTDAPTQNRIREIFEFAASLFDEIMIDDFWFTDCACPECEEGRKSKKVKIGDREFSATGESWEDYRGELMLRLSELHLLNASKAINPRAKLIIKYPQWYDRFHERGYDVARETASFDWIWVGTETRDYGDKRWGGTVQYEAYFIMRWLGGIGEEKCGGGWFDWLGTTEKTYIEQARQTVLGGARESMLFCYGGLQRDTGPKNVAALREVLPELWRTAKEANAREIVGVAAYKPANSAGLKEQRIFDFVGMLGIPLVPCHEFPTNAPAAFFSVHALKDPDFAEKLQRFAAAGKPVLITDGLWEALGSKAPQKQSVKVLAVRGEPKSLLDLGEKELNELRQPLLASFKSSFRAPNKVGLYLFSDGSWVIENFNDESVTATLDGRAVEVGGRNWKYEWR